MSESDIAIRVEDVTKRFRLTERLQLDYMATISNIFNHPNFAFPGSNISAPGQASIITTCLQLASSARNSV